MVHIYKILMALFPNLTAVKGLISGSGRPFAIEWSAEPQAQCLPQVTFSYLWSYYIVILLRNWRSFVSTQTARLCYALIEWCRQDLLTCIAMTTGLYP